MSQQQPPAFQPPHPPVQQFQAQPPYQQQVPTGMLQLTIQGSALTSSMIPPTVQLNGYLVPVKYGRNDIPVFAGPLHIDVHSQWMLTYGRAAIDCTVQPNQVVPVFYASPFHQFTSGSIGFTEVKRKGLGVLLGVVGAIVAVVVVATVLAALGS